MNEFSAAPTPQPAAAMDSRAFERRAAHAEAFLRSLASRHRLMILCVLLEREASVSELGARLGLTQSNLSRHLATLRAEGLVATRRERTTIYYNIESERVRPILAELDRMFCQPDPLEGSAA